MYTKREGANFCMSPICFNKHCGCKGAVTFTHCVGEWDALLGGGVRGHDGEVGRAQVARVFILLVVEPVAALVCKKKPPV